MNKKQCLTRKIQLLIDSDDKELRKQTYETLYQWQRICVKAANYIFTHHYLQEQVKELFYLTDNVKVKLANIEKDEDGILTTSKLNTTYQVLSRHFKGSIPMGILACLNNALSATYQKERMDYHIGIRSIRNYKRDIPMPFSAEDIRQWQVMPSGRNFSFRLFGLPFRTYLGKDVYDKKVLLEQVVGQTTVLRTSSLQLDNGKIFLLAAFDSRQDHHPLEAAVIAEASLAIDNPIVVTIHKSRYVIGNKEEFLHRRLAIQAARQRIQKGASFNKPAHGRKRKLKGTDRLADAEAQYVDNKLHLYSRKLVDLCIRHRVATLMLTNHSEATSHLAEDQFLLRNWSYGSLKEKITYKAAKAGIAIITE